MDKQKVLFICHNHPAVRPGGAEGYAFELFEAMGASEEFSPIFLARTGPPISTAASPRPRTPLGTLDGAQDQYLLYTDIRQFDHFHATLRDKTVYTRHLRDFLLAHRPDVVHFQHTYLLGVDAITEVRNTLPNVPIVYTLHEFLPICHRSGQMVRTGTNELCSQESPRRCHECFPSITPERFFMRKRFIQSHLSHVDVFLAPSKLLLERYVDWGIPRERIRFEDYGRRPVRRVPEAGVRSRNRFGFFGQLSFFKGADVLLKAMAILAEEDSDAHLWVHGANLELQPVDFQEQFIALAEGAQTHVTLAGRYDQVRMPALMSQVDWVVVPSVWWENSPLVIQEAFLHGRPVICSDIGGMAEKVADGVSGLHFRSGDPRSLAHAIRTAVETPHLWEELHRGIPPIYDMEKHVTSLALTYDALVTRRRDGHASDASARSGEEGHVARTTV
jgi:glycosyltransferase involved in cell wall biosynthesis